MQWDELKNNPDKLKDKANETSASEVARNHGIDHKTVTYWLDKHDYIYHNRKWIQKDNINQKSSNNNSNNNKSTMDDPVREVEDNTDSIHIEEYPNYYYFFDKKHDVVISKKLLKEIYWWYCEQGLTQKETYEKANITYQQFRLIKKALNLVHADKPHPDYEFRDKSVENLVNNTISRKKQKYDELYEIKEKRRLKRIEKNICSNIISPKW